MENNAKTSFHDDLADLLTMRPKLVWEDTVEDRARAVVGCYLEDVNEHQNPGELVTLSLFERNVLIHHIEIAIHAQRTEWQEVTE